MNIYGIVATDLDGAIGYRNELLWSLPNDMKYFRQITSDTTVIMGRKTYESIGRPLPKRNNIVITTGNTVLPEKNLYIARNKDQALRIAKSLNKNVMIIGGSKIYSLFEDDIEYLYLTLVHTKVKIVDAWFNEFNKLPTHYRMVSNLTKKADKNHRYDYDFRVYKRVGIPR